MEYQTLGIDAPVLDPAEEEKQPESGSTSSEVTQKLERLAHQVEIHMEMLLSTVGYSDDVK